VVSISKSPVSGTGAETHTLVKTPGAGWILVYDGWLCEEGIITVLAVAVDEMNTICIGHGEGLGVVEASIAINVVKVEKLD
jgi:hypothetical protein